MNLRTTMNTSRLGLQNLLAGLTLVLVLATQLLGPMALPVGTVIRTDQSLIIGSGDNWVGRVVLDVGRDLDAAYAFFLESYPAQGWSVVSAIRGKTSLMVLARGDRTATLEMNDGGLLGSTVVMTVAPKNANVAAPKKL
jgi:hypothetical protein